MNSGRILVNGSDFYCGSGTNSLCQLALKTDVGSPYVHPSEIQCNAASEISSLKSSVSSGKAQIASAITGKGVSTSSSASFSTMASNIKNISTGYDFKNGTYNYQSSDKTVSSSTKYIIVCEYGKSSLSTHMYVIDVKEKTCIDIYHGNGIDTFKISNKVLNSSGEFSMHCRTDSNTAYVYYKPSTRKIRTSGSGRYILIT